MRGLRGQDTAEFESEEFFTPDIKNGISQRFEGFLNKVTPFLAALQTWSVIPVNITNGKWGHQHEDCTGYSCIKKEAQLWTPREVIFSSLAMIPPDIIDLFWSYSFTGLAHELGHHYFQSKLRTEHAAFFRKQYLESNQLDTVGETSNFDIKLWLACEELFADIFAGLINSDLGVMSGQFGPKSIMPNPNESKYRAFNPDENYYFNDPIEFIHPYYLLGKVRSFVARRVQMNSKTSIDEKVRIANLIRDVLVEAIFELNLEPNSYTEDPTTSIKAFNSKLIKSLEKL